MNQVDIIKAGTVADLYRQLGEFQGEALLLLQNGPRVAQVSFKNGLIQRAELGLRRREEAAHEILQWSTGHYSLITRTPVQPNGADVLLVGADMETRHELDVWLSDQGYDTAIVTSVSQVIDAALFAEPYAIVMACPVSELDLGCGQLRDQLKRMMLRPPALITLTRAEARCSVPTQLCLTLPLEGDKRRELGKLIHFAVSSRSGLAHRAVRVPAPAPTDEGTGTLPGVCAPRRGSGSFRDS